MKKLMKTYVLNAVQSHLRTYPVAVSVSYLWSTGSLLGIFILLQICTGLLLVSHHISGAEDNAFFVATIVEYISREGIDYPVLIRYAHSSATSFIFALMYLHIGRILYSRAYANPRPEIFTVPAGSIIWLTLVTLFLVISGLEYSACTLKKGTLPDDNEEEVLKDIIIILLNKFSVDLFIISKVNAVLSIINLHFYLILHFMLTFAVVFLFLLHVFCLQKAIARAQLIEHSSFLSNFNFKYVLFIVPVLFIYTVDILSFAGLLPEKYNILNIGAYDFKYYDQYYRVANIKVKWYFLPFFSIIRSFNLLSLPGVVIFYVLLVLVLLVLFLPCFDTTCDFRSTAFKHIYLISFFLFSIIFIILGFVGTIPPTHPYLNELNDILTIFFLINFVLISLASHLEFLVDGVWFDTKLGLKYDSLKLRHKLLEDLNSDLKIEATKVSEDNIRLHEEIEFLKRKDFFYRPKK